MLVDIDRETQSVFRAGNGVVGVDPIALYPVSVSVHKSVTVRADSANTSTIRISNSAANAANGFVLSAGQQSPPICVDDLNKVYLISFVGIVGTMNRRNFDSCRCFSGSSSIFGPGCGFNSNRTRRMSAGGPDNLSETEP